MSDEYNLKGLDWWADRFTRRPVRTTLQLVLALTGCVLAVMVILWTTGVVIAPWKAAGDISQERNGAPNRIAQQGQFSDDKNAFTASLETIQGSQMAIDQLTITPPVAGPTDPVTAYQNAQQVTELRGELQGAITHCQNLAADYDSLASKTLSADLQGADLPVSLDGTQCQQTATQQLANDKAIASRSQAAPSTTTGPTG
jgi:hypothetical protein